jgi:hypothetical protein
MHLRWIAAALAAGLASTVVGEASAQMRLAQSSQPSIMNEEEGSVPAVPPPPARSRAPKQKPAFEHDPDLDAADQLAPSQVQQPMPGAVAMPTGGGHTSRGTHAAARNGDAAVEPGADQGTVSVARRSRTAKSQPHVIACSGVFAKDSSHAKLAAAFQPRNVSFSQVDSSTGGKVMASVVFPKDPKQRLEVWWSKPDARSDTHLIVVNGQSDWIAPGELHLGLTLAALEQLNGKPFKLLGFDKDHVATLTDWNGGQLGALAGGCKIGISLRPDPKTAAAALGDLPADRSFTSADQALRAVNPTVTEILITY